MREENSAPDFAARCKDGDTRFLENNFPQQMLGHRV
jgi:hypothetical protein